MKKGVYVEDWGLGEVMEGLKMALAWNSGVRCIYTVFKCDIFLGDSQLALTAPASASPSFPEPADLTYCSVALASRRIAQLTPTTRASPSFPAMPDEETGDVEKIR
nr:hypothetical protein Itr_chr02CG13860 [Ipomoea trifida]